MKKNISKLEISGSKDKLKEKANPAKFFRGFTMLLAFSLTLLFSCGEDGLKDEVKGKADAENLSFQVRIEQFTAGETFTTTEILAGVNGKKTGYTLKSISNIKPSDVVSLTGKAPNFSLKILKLGTCTATIVLQHPSKKDVTLKDCQFEITKAGAESLNFQEVSKVFVKGGKFTTAEILAKVQGTKTGYTIKEINTLTPNDFATVSDTGKELNFKNKAGRFTATIILEHSTKADVTLTSCAFKITTATAPTLSFQEVSKQFTSDGQFSTADILRGVRGAKEGYTIKNITALNPRNLATITSTKELKFIGGLGSFTATIVLEHPTKADVTLNCKFEITMADAEKLTFKKLSKAFSGIGQFSSADILAKVRGTKTGYTIKEITDINPSNLVTVSYTGKDLNFKNKAGSFTATIILKHPNKMDATIKNCAFEITKNKAPILGIWNISRRISSSVKFTTSDILSNVHVLYGHSSEKTGYTIKQITNLNPNNLARVTPEKELIFEKNKIGVFTATIVLEHPTKADRIITNCRFEIYTIFNLTSDGVLSIKTGVDKKTITKVTIPPSINGVNITSIGDYTFWNCSSLTSITLPNSLTSIGMGAFKDCTSLKSITLPNSVTTIDDNAFYECTSLTSITLPNSVTSIGIYAFQYCRSLTSITLPNSLKTISNSAFGGCSSLTSITLPNSITTIGDAAFGDCSSLTSITLPNSVTAIGGYVFTGCTSLSSITLPNSLKTIGGYAFYKCTSLTSITLPNSLTSTGKSTFDGCSSLTSITIPNSVKTIDYGAFKDCTSLTSITIPNSVNRIGDRTFHSCTSLTSITIPNSVIYIGGGTYRGETFKNCTSLTSITLPNSIISIGKSFFSGCTSLTSVTIPSSVTTIGDRAFYGWTKSQTIRVPRAKRSWWLDKLKEGNTLTDSNIIGYE